MRPTLFIAFTFLFSSPLLAQDRVPTPKELAVMRRMANHAIMRQTQIGVRQRTVHPRRYTASNSVVLHSTQNRVAARNAYRRGQLYWYHPHGNYIPPLKVRYTRYGLRFYRW